MAARNTPTTDMADMADTDTALVSHLVILGRFLGKHPLERRII